jgi:hypothetical protein
MPMIAIATRKTKNTTIARRPSLPNERAPPPEASVAISNDATRGTTVMRNAFTHIVPIGVTKSANA